MYQIFEYFIYTLSKMINDSQNLEIIGIPNFA